ncbi:MAG TPA: gamma-glutamylcyclotransferase family protein, partial [Pirellulaceae bacterium]|nr:gamma-glutamylcyclotransferase family protein [Pirellulaceae bacterium]
MGEPALPIFVYGTLQRGPCRERCWPRQPLRVESARVRAALYDLGPYPALVASDDKIAEELWQLAEGDLPVTLAELDRVEGYAGQIDDLYRRATISCQTASGSVEAW